ncbi:MAG: hypothetical protein AAGF93_03625 [Cyanobacteria bacterium P01_H01_bin.105]
MNNKLVISNTILGTFALALAGYAQSNVNTDSQYLSDIEARACPVFLNDVMATDVSDNSQQLAIPIRSNEESAVLDLTLLCHSEPLETAASGRVGTDTNNQPIETPQSATQFDQLPQDRVEFGSPI